MLRKLYALLVILLLQTFGSASAQIQSFPSQLIGGWCNDQLPTYGSIISLDYYAVLENGRLIEGGYEITRWESTESAFYFLVERTLTNITTKTPKKVLRADGEHLILSNSTPNFYRWEGDNFVERAGVALSSLNFGSESLSFHQCTDQEFVKAGVKATDIPELRKKFKSQREILSLTPNNSPVFAPPQEDQSPDNNDRNLAKNSKTTTKDLRGRLSAGLDGWVNDTWRIMPKGTTEDIFPNWNGPVLQMNFPPNYCYQNYQYIYECYYKVATREIAAKMQCIPNVVCHFIDGIEPETLKENWPRSFVGSAWYDGKLALTFVNVEADGRPNTLEEWQDMCIGRIRQHNPVGVPLPQCYYGGLAEAGKGVLVNDAGQLGPNPKIVWMAMAISPDTANEHIGGVHLASAFTALEAYDGAMYFCEELSTTGNCFVVEIRATKPGVTLGTTFIDSDGNWP